uniref:CYP65EY1 n=1 Tax=Hormonema carpetanum TaxID=284138 RepID=A0A897Q8M4_HORCR|nr:CYP65EY1 [Hormonema carpetanum]
METKFTIFELSSFYDLIVVSFVILGAVRSAADIFSLSELTAFQAAVLTTLSKGFYNIYLHPLSRFPGPKLAASTRLWYVYHNLRGHYPRVVLELSKKYGNVIRVAPNELCYTDGEAWNGIYGHRIGSSELDKDDMFYRDGSMGSITSARKDRHTILRKSLSPGFSERALRDQEAVIRSLADLCITRLYENSDNGHNLVDLVQWLNFFTFDVTGQLVFGESFGCLDGSAYHVWIKVIFNSIRAFMFFRCTKYWSITSALTPYLLTKDMMKRRRDHRDMSVAKANQRKAQGFEKNDLISGLLNPSAGVHEREYRATAQILITAGSETTATLMSGAFYFLLMNPGKLRLLEASVRDSFSNAAEITFASTNKLEYLIACINESFRMYPPVPDVLPRNTGAQAVIVSGMEVPPHVRAPQLLLVAFQLIQIIQTTLGISQWATYQSPANFTKPDEFIPERWLEDLEFRNDKKSALQPFSVGPRNCIGKT